MSGLSLSALLIRLILGGTAVVASTVIARKMGDRAGGIFAAFPAGGPDDEVVLYFNVRT